MIDSVAARRIAVLIDADQISPDHLDSIMNAAAKEGSVVVLRGYRHWDENSRTGWSKACKKHGLEQEEEAAGRNAADIALAIDAVDLIHQRCLDGFVIVCNDKDLTPLAGRLKRGRLRAVLIGDPAKVKGDSLAAWDAFLPLDKRPETSAKAGAAGQTTGTKTDRKMLDAYRKAYRESHQDPHGWAPLSEVSKRVDKSLRPNTPSKWLKTQGFDVEPKHPFGGKGETTCIRLADKTGSSAA